ncbi:MAG: 30S ribosomal protein S2 [Planctomycetota bacterium]
MSIVSVQELLESGVHFGHRTSRWNPKMAPFIFGKRNLIHIIDIRQTVRGLVRAYRFLERLTAAGGQVIFVGTKRQSRIIIAEEATRARMPYVSERWLGGTLTNHATIRSRVKRLAELETIAGDNPSPDLSKKELSSLRRKLRKMEKNLSGIRNLNGIPGALVIVDSRREFNAVREARRTHVPVIALVDTDCNPEEIDIPIPCNDDSARTIRLLLRKLADAVVAGQSQFAVSPRSAGAATATAARAESQLP